MESQLICRCSIDLPIWALPPSLNWRQVSVHLRQTFTVMASLLLFFPCKLSTDTCLLSLLMLFSQVCRIYCNQQQQHWGTTCMNSQADSKKELADPCRDLNGVSVKWCSPHMQENLICFIAMAFRVLWVMSNQHKCRAFKALIAPAKNQLIIWGQSHSHLLIELSSQRSNLLLWLWHIHCTLFDDNVYNFIIGQPSRLGVKSDAQSSSLTAPSQSKPLQNRNCSNNVDESLQLRIITGNLSRAKFITKADTSAMYSSSISL